MASIWLLFSSLVTYSSIGHATDFKPKVYGPGLKHDFVVLARYFFIEMRPTLSKPVTDINKDEFDIQVDQQDGNRARVQSQTFDRQDGSFIVRYRVHQFYSNGIVISVRYRGNHIGNSPYSLDGPIYPESCNCPRNAITWLASMECPASYDQIQTDLAPFNRGINISSALNSAKSRFKSRGSYSFCHYAIKNNKVYRECFGEHVGFKMFMDNIVLSLLRKVKVPDMEFISNLGDWPLENGRDKKSSLIPIFSWCGSDDTFDIVMPTYDVTESTLESMGRVTLDLMSVQGHTGPAWSDKIDKALFRGRDSRQERLDLARLGQKHPDKLDVGLTNYFFFPQDDELYGAKQKHVSFFDFFKYRYQVNIDGTVAAYRFPYLLAGDSLVLKQDSPYYEHFYKRVTPYQHYLPVQRNLSDLLSQLHWARHNQDKVQEMISNAQRFVRNNLMARDIYCYYFKLFAEYADKLVEEVVVSDSMELVDQPADRSQCTCPGEPTQQQKSREEL